MMMKYMNQLIKENKYKTKNNKRMKIKIKCL